MTHRSLMLVWLMAQMVAVLAVAACTGASTAHADAAPLALTEPYDTGSPVVETIWVDSRIGSDSGNGSSAQPVRTISEAWSRIPRDVTLTQGYRIMLRPGHWTEAQMPPYWESRHATANAPIFLQAAGAPGSAHLSAMNVFDTDHLYLIGVHLRARGGDTFHCEQCSHLLIRDSIIEGIGDVMNDGGPHEGIKINQSSHVYIEHSDIQGAGQNPIDFVAVQHGHIITSTIHRGGDWCHYMKGGSAYIVVEANEYYSCGTGGFLAGQGTGFEYMVAPWLYHEAVDIKFVNNVVHHVDGAAFGVNGAHSVLLAYNSAWRVGARSHVLEFAMGGRSCDGEVSACAAHNSAGGWGPSSPAQAPDGEPIGNVHVFAYNNAIANPPGASSQWQHLQVDAPRTTGGSSNIPSPQKADEDLRIVGNAVFNGSADHPLGVADDGTGCRDSNTSCNPTQLAADNVFAAASSSVFAQPAAGVFLPAGAMLGLVSAAVPAFDYTNLPGSQPAGTTSNAVMVDRAGRSRSAGAPAGAFASADTVATSVISYGVRGRGSVRPDRFGSRCTVDQCEARYERQAWVTLRARPAAGWRFVRWRGRCIGWSGATCVLPASGAGYARAVFVRR